MVLVVAVPLVVLAVAVPLEAAAAVDHSVAAEAEVPSEAVVMAEVLMAEVLTVEDILADVVSPLQLQNAHLSIHHQLYLTHGTAGINRQNSLVDDAMTYGHHPFPREGGRNI